MCLTIPFISRVSREETGRWLTALQFAMPDHHILPLDQIPDGQRQNIEFAIVANPDPVALQTLPGLKWVQSLWAGVERLVAELPENGCKIVRMTDPQLAQTMAEAVLAWTLYLHRDMPRYRAQQSAKLWLQHEVRLAANRTIGILGLGNMGRAAAATLKTQGFRVCGWSRTETRLEGMETFSGLAGLNTILGCSQILVILLPLTPDTNGLIHAQRLQHLPKNAAIINFGRGAILDEAALMESLDSKHISHAVLDVFAQEPLPPDHRFWSHPDVTVLPHISAPTNFDTASGIVAQNIDAYLTTGLVPAHVDRKRGY